jgi:hypothetical protein
MTINEAPMAFAAAAIDLDDEMPAQVELGDRWLVAAQPQRRQVKRPASRRFGTLIERSVQFSRWSRCADWVRWPGGRTRVRC